MGICMKKILMLLCLVFLFTGCNTPADIPKPQPEPRETPAQTAPSSTPTPSQPPKEPIKVTVLKGATGLGMLGLMEKNEIAGGADYSFNIVGAADQISTDIIKGDTDIAAVPCNLASVLYNKSKGKVKVAAVNTLGVLYMLENGSTVNSIEDLKGKTVETVGKGTTPEYTLKHILQANGLDADVNVEFKSEATELASLLVAGQSKLAMLPEPFVTTVLSKNPDMRIALDMTEEWNKVSENPLVTGVVIFRDSLPKETVDAFLKEYENSINSVTADPENASLLSEKFDIMPAAVVKKALQRCNIVFVAGQEMKDYISNYLTVLFQADSASVGGALPDEGFYYIN